MLDGLNPEGNNREAVIAITREQFDILALRLTKQVSFSDGKSHSVCLVLPGFTCFQFLHDSFSLSDEFIFQWKAEVKHGLRISNLMSL